MGKAKARLVKGKRQAKFFYREKASLGLARRTKLLKVRQPTVKTIIPRRKGWFRERRKIQLHFSAIVISETRLRKGQLNRAFVMRGIFVEVNTSLTQVSRIAGKVVKDVEDEIIRRFPTGVVLAIQLDSVLVGKRTDEPNQFLGRVEEFRMLRHAKRKLREMT